MRERGRKEGYEVTQHYEAKTGTNECQQSKEKADTIRYEAKTGTNKCQASKQGSTEHNEAKTDTGDNKQAIG